MTYQQKMAIIDALSPRPTDQQDDDGFGPNHKDWRIPSKRNTYLFKNLGAMYLDGKVLRQNAQQQAESNMSKEEKIFKEMRLPPGFGPHHKDWKIPSKRNKYLKLLEEGKI